LLRLREVFLQRYEDFEKGGPTRYLIVWRENPDLVCEVTERAFKELRKEQKRWRRCGG
jgi:hypothetical protein